MPTKLFIYECSECGKGIPSGRERRLPRTIGPNTKTYYRVCTTCKRKEENKTMTKVEFKFAVDEKIRTELGDKGIVRMLAFDEAGNQYSVITKNGQAWFKERELSKSTGARARK